LNEILLQKRGYRIKDKNLFIWIFFKFTLSAFKLIYEKNASQ